MSTIIAKREKTINELRHEQAQLCAHCADAAPVYLRFKRAPKCGRSYNWRDGYYEAGVSVYRGYALTDGRYVVDMRGISGAAAQLTAHSFDPVYLISGDVLDTTGGDNEPLLINITKQRKLNLDQIAYLVSDDDVQFLPRV